MTTKKYNKKSNKKIIRGSGRTNQPSQPPKSFRPRPLTTAEQDEIKSRAITDDEKQNVISIYRNIIPYQMHDTVVSYGLSSSVDSYDTVDDRNNTVLIPNQDQNIPPRRILVSNPRSVVSPYYSEIGITRGENLINKYIIDERMYDKMFDHIDNPYDKKRAIDDYRNRNHQNNTGGRKLRKSKTKRNKKSKKKYMGKKRRISLMKKIKMKAGSKKSLTSL